MAFTAGSPELAKANKLGAQLSALLVTYGTNGGFTGNTGASLIERYAEKLGFGITGLTTGAAFPPFGTAPTSLGIEASLQNPRGETMASGISLGAFAGNTLGIYMKKFIYSGAGYRARQHAGVTLAKSMPVVGGTSFSARGPVEVGVGYILAFGDDQYVVTGATSASGAGSTCDIVVSSAIAKTYATGAAFDVIVVGVTRGTSGVAGATTEAFVRNTQVNAGFTAAIYFTTPTNGSPTYTVS